jgi:hypothetical protein
MGTMGRVMSNGFECTDCIIQSGPTVSQRQVQLKQVVQAALKAALYVSPVNLRKKLQKKY